MLDVSSRQAEAGSYTPARDALERHLVWDNHGCLPLRPDDTRFLPQLWRYRESGVDHVSINIGFGSQGPEEHLHMLAAFRHWLAQRPEQYVLVRTADDIERAHSTSRLAVSFDIEGANGIGDRLELIQLYYDLGVRWMLLAYNRNSAAGGGCQDVDAGLQDFGRKMIDEMTRVGMVVCLSHVGERTARDAMEHARGPVVFSHSNPAALRAHPRNITIDLMRRCAATGGVVGINGVGPFLGDDDTRSETVVRHVDHAVQEIGAQHVGLGLDYVFDQEEVDAGMAAMKDTFPPELGYGRGMHFVRPEQLEEIVEGLLRLGYADTDLAAILGGNWMRIARTCWRPPA